MLYWTFGIIGGIIVGIIVLAFRADPEQIDIPELGEQLPLNGENDMIVPYGKDKPFSILDQRAELSLPGLTFEIGLSNKGNEREMNEVLRKFRINPGVTMPAWAFSWIRDVAFPRDICGSGCIAKGIRSRGNVTFYTISDASHAFMMNEQGDFNKTYQLVRDRIGKFVR